MTGAQWSGRGSEGIALPDRYADDPAAQAIASELAAKPRGQLVLDALPFVVMGVVTLIDVVVGPAVAFMQLLSLGPALAAVSGTVRRTGLIGAAALVLCQILALYNEIVGSSRNNLALATVAGVTVAGAIASAGRQRRERELASVRLVAEVAQRVLLRPVPRTVGPLRMAVRYISAATEARIGGDLCEVVATPDAVRLIIGDVQGKGLTAVETAATMVGVFREAAHDAADLVTVAARLDATLTRSGRAEEFVTAILIEIHPEVDQIEVLNCGWFRRNHLVPVPEVNSLAELNALIEHWDIQDESRRIGSRPRTIGEYFAIERPLLKPLPDEPFETGLLLSPRVDRYSQIGVRTNRYSVPARLIGRRVRVMLHASELIVYDGRTEVARHERLLAKGSCRLELDHYLEVLIRKPGALPGATALDQARAAGKFTPVHDRWWAAACKAHGDPDGTRALIEVLLLARHMQHEHIVAGLVAALEAGALTADAVALEARKAAETDQSTLTGPLDPFQVGQLPPAEPEAAGLDPATVTFLTERRLAHLPPDTWPVPSVAVYDQLLRHRRPDAGRPAEGETP